MSNTPSPEDRKKFAQSQLQFLKSKGITNNLRLSRIFKAAGPGQIQAAWELVEQAKTQVEKDVLDCLLTGVQGSQDFGRDRMEAVLMASGFAVPEVTSDRAFFRMLDGAMELLVPNSYEFTDQELEEIEEGVRRHKERAEHFKQLGESNGTRKEETSQTEA